MGHIKLTFSDDGDLVSWRGSPILLDSSYPQDPVIVKKIYPMRARLAWNVVGTSETLLLQSRTGESNIGNFVTDAMVSSWKGKGMPNGGKVSNILYRPANIFIKTINISVLDFVIPELYGPTLRREMSHKMI